ncbi:MAG: HNH endonuclease [Salinibacterium sp.]|nr:MAG: HNH endonuclease [Salinibacterium sp.]
MSSSRRLSPLPKDWPRIRRLVLERDEGFCQIRLVGCTMIATEVDHIGDRDDHSEDNLRSACKACHQKRTYMQTLGHAPRRRPSEPHPGLIA